jgi:hypothetical protein
MFRGIFGWLVIGLLIGSLAGISFGLRTAKEIGREEFPNDGIWRSARIALLVGLGCALLAGLSGGLASWLMIENPLAVLLLLFWILFGLQFGAAVSGGHPVLRHIVLRWQLWREGVTPKPWRYVPFLEAMTEHMLLDRIGGAYKFKHDLLQRHIAQLTDSFIADLNERHSQAHRKRKGHTD